MQKSAFSISIEVPPAVFARWARAMQNLSRALQIEVVEDPAGPVVVGAPRFTCTGLEFLLRLGLACGRPERADEPAGLFGLFRYATSLAETGSVLAVDAALEIDTHKKRLMSDEFGCAMALVTADRFLNARLTIDVELAIARGWLKTSAPQSRRPDYMVIQRGKPRTLAILEAKGSQQSPSYARWQLSSGCGQVTKVSVPNSPYTISTRIVTATLLRWDGQGPTMLFVGDPEPDTSPDIYHFDVSPLECAFRNHYVRVASLAGDTGLIRLLTMNDGSTAEPLMVREIRGHRYVGSEIRATSGSRSMALFFGIRSDVVGALRRLSDAAEIEHFVEDTTERGVGAETIANGADQATIGADGTALMVTLRDARN